MQLLAQIIVAIYVGKDTRLLSHDHMLNPELYTHFHPMQSPDHRDSKETLTSTSANTPLTHYRRHTAATRYSVHHGNIKPEGTQHPTTFTSNVCIQLHLMLWVVSVYRYEFELHRVSLWVHVSLLGVVLCFCSFSRATMLLQLKKTYM